MSKLSFATQTPIDIYAQVSRTRLAAEEIRLGMRRPDDAIYRSPFAPAAPGVVHYRASPAAGGIQILSERGLLALMSRHATGQGGDALHQAIAANSRFGSLSPLRPFPRNDVAMLQPGDDVLMGGKRHRVVSIQVGWSSHDQSAVTWGMAARGKVMVHLADGIRVPGDAIGPHNATRGTPETTQLSLLRHVHSDAMRRLAAAANPRHQAHNWTETYKLASTARSAVDAMLVEVGTQRSGHIPKGVAGQEAMQNRALRVRGANLANETQQLSNVMRFDDWQGCSRLVDELRGEHSEVRAALKQMHKDSRLERLAVQQMANAPRY